MNRPKLELCPICGAELQIHGPEDWKPSFYDPDSGGDPYNATCECGFSFSTGTYDHEEFFEACNRRAILPDNNPLTVEELREMVGAWVWVIVQYENGKCNGWALVATPAYIGFLEQTIPIDFCGRKFVAYRRPPEKED